MDDSRDDGARWELRTWNPREEQRELLRSMGTASDERTVVDRYLLGNEQRCSAKFRGGTLSVKRFLEHAEGFERWTPAWEARGPIETDLVRRLFSELGVARMPAGLDGMILPMSAGAIETHMENLPGVGWAELTKQRVDIELPSALGELTLVDFGGDAQEWSLAIEGTDLGVLVAIRAELGLDGADNVAMHRAAGAALAED
jgi:hypothetical protein